MVMELRTADLDLTDEQHSILFAGVHAADGVSRNESPGSDTAYYRQFMPLVTNEEPYVPFTLTRGLRQHFPR